MYSGLARISLILTPCLLVACASETSEQAQQPEAANEGMDIRPLSESETSPTDGANARVIADLLFEALQALDADRLLTPVDDNAHARFRRVLAYDPNNEIALQGLQDIVQRYIELSTEAGRRGMFEEAEALLNRARFVDEDHPAIAEALSVIQAEKNSGDLFFELDGRELSSRSEAVQEEIASIAEQARDNSAFFLITAPNDDLARWIFSVMRDAVPGYRLRGNIELAGRSGVRLRLPDEANQ